MNIAKNQRVAEAIVRLQNNPDFKIFLDEGVQPYRYELLEFTMYGQPDQVQSYAGMARAVTELLRAIGGAAETLEKMHAKQKRGH